MTNKEQTILSIDMRNLERLFDLLNNRFFNGELEKATITLQPSKHAYGWITTWKKWTNVNGETEGHYEININLDMTHRTPLAITGTLLHEMVHLYNLQNGIQDCSRGNRYHNKKFRDKAESVGLTIEHNESIGWSITHPRNEVKEFIDCIRYNGFVVREKGFVVPTATGTPTTGTGTGGIDIPIGRGTGSGRKKPTSTRKYVCKSCGTSIRATKTVNIICGDCNEQMVEA